MLAFKSTKGVGHIEVLVALWVFSFGCLSLLSYEIKLQREQNVIQARQVALDLASSQLTESRALLTPDDFDMLTSGSRTDPSGRFQLAWHVISDSYYEKQVTVQVFWQDSDGPQQLQLSTLIARTVAANR